MEMANYVDPDKIFDAIYDALPDNGDGFLYGNTDNVHAVIYDQIIEILKESGIDV